MGSGSSSHFFRGVQPGRRQDLESEDYRDISWSYDEDQDIEDFGFDDYDYRDEHYENDYRDSRLTLSAQSIFDSILTRLFPERQIFFRSRGEMRYLVLPRWIQIMAATAALAFVGWLGYTTGHYLSYDEVLDSKERLIAEAQVAQQAVVAEVTRYQERFDQVRQNLEQRRKMLASLIEQTGVAKSGGGAIDGGKLDRPVKLARARDATSAPRRFAMRGKWPQPSARGDSLWQSFDRMQTDFKAVVADRASVVGERDQLLSRVQELQNELSSIRTTQEEVLRRVTRSTDDNVVEVEKLISLTGLNVDNLLGRLKKIDGKPGRQFGQGGPFVEMASLSLSPNDPLASKVVALDERMERRRNLQQLLLKLPLVSPVDLYRVTSNFGRRVDPMRKRWAQHSGLDMANALGTPVYAPAAGKVTFAGWRGNYGRFVEIDHGLGMITRYAHLKKLLVKKGQRV